jgi:FkbM family methyltransferase
MSVRAQLAVRLGHCQTVEYPTSGIRVVVKPHWLWGALMHRQWEEDCIRYASGLVKEPCTVLDVGAWAGPYTLLFSKLMGDQGLVCAFEPDPKAFVILRDNVEKNRLTNVRLERLCVSNAVGRATLNAEWLGEGTSHLAEPIEGSATREVVVETTTIDRYCSDNHIRPAGIKIDVEGAEGLVIDGCTSVIQKYSPWVLLEFHGGHMSEEARDANWRKIVNRAREVVYIDGSDNEYHYGDNVRHMPNCPYFHIFIRY